MTANLETKPRYASGPTRQFTVVTQFPAKSGILKAINRLYIQDGKIILNAALSFAGTTVNVSIANEFFTGRGGHFMDLGGVGGMSEVLSRERCWFLVCGGRKWRHELVG